MRAVPLYAAAALAEIAGSFAFWARLRLGRSALWLAPVMLTPAAFAWLLARVPAGRAGRAYASCGGVCVAASLLRLWAAEGQRPDCWDLLGAAVILTGAAIILWAPRAG